MKKNRALLKISEIISTWFWVGKIPWAPGTWGALAALPLVYALSVFGPIVYMAVTMIFIFIGIFAADVYGSSMAHHDSGEIVIDEVVGLLIALTWMPMTYQALIVGFIIFRIFDILKPFPISWLDQKVKGGLGVMIDDIAAGFITNLILQIIYTHTDWLGAQLIYVAS